MTAPCPAWCAQADDHPADIEDGARVHGARIGRWAAVSQVEAPGIWFPAVVVIDDDVELLPDNAIALALDIAGAASILRDAQ